MALVWSQALTAGQSRAGQPESVIQSGKGTLEMNLTEAVMVGLRHNRQIKGYYMDRVLEKFDLAKDRREFHPNITITGELSAWAKRTATDYRDKDSSVVHQGQREAKVTPELTQKLPTGGELTFKHTWSHTTDWDRSSGSSWDNEGEFSAEFSQPLLKGAGLDYNTADLEKTRLDSREAVLNLRDKISTKVQGIVSKYNLLWSAQQNLEIARKSLEDARTQLEINRLLIANGRKPEGDIYQAEANVARQELNFEDAQNSLDQARLALLDILDLSQDLELEASEDYAYSPRQPEIKACLELARRQNTDLVSAKDEVRRKELDLMQAKRDQLWDLSLDAKYTHTGHEASETSGEYGKRHWKIDLDLEIPIHLWGQGRYTHELDLLQARIALDKARMDYKEAQEDLRTTVLNKVRNLRHAAKKVELSRKSTELSRKNYQMDEVKLRLGRITNNEFIDTQERLSQAKQDEVQAVIGYIDRINGLDSFLGTLLKTYGIEFQESRPGQEEKYLPGKTWMLDHRD